MPGGGPTSSPRPAPQPKPDEPVVGSVPNLFERLLASRWSLPVALLVGLLLRLAHGLALSRTPLYDHLGLDCEVYDEWARRIAAGDWMGSRIFYQDPLYPYFLGVLYAVFGRSLLVVYLVQGALGLATCWLTALLGRRIFDRASGNLAGWLAALFVPSIFYEVQVEKTFLSVFLVVAFLVAFLDRRRRTRFLAGILLALACLTRANLILFLPLGALVLASERPRSEGSTSRGEASGLARGRTAWSPGHAAAFALGAAIVLGPVALRNHHVGGRWVLTTSQAGQNFYIGNNPLNTTGSYIVPPTIRPDPHFEETDFKAEAERRAGRSLGPPEVSAWWWNEAWRHIASNPAFARMMFLRKLFVFWNDYEVPDNLNMYMLGRFSPVMAAPLPGLGLLAAFALLGAIVAVPRSIDSRWLVGFVAVYCATVVAFFVLSRYRIQVVPVLAVFAGHALVWVGREAAARKWRSVAVAAVVVGLASSFCFQSLAWSERDKAIAISLNNLAAMYMESGDTDRGIATYEEAVRLRPDSVVGAIRLLGDWYRRQGDFARAESHMKHVVNLKPDSRMGWNALADLYLQRRAAGGQVPAADLVAALLSAGRVEQARAEAAAAEAGGGSIDARLRDRLASGR